MGRRLSKAACGWTTVQFFNKNIVKICKATDGPTAALMHDLKQRGLLDSTLVVWGGEFGRTPGKPRNPGMAMRRRKRYCHR